MGSDYPRARIIPTALAAAGISPAIGISPATGAEPQGGTLSPGPLFAKPPPKGQEGTETGTHCSVWALPVPPCPWTVSPASARGEECFPACKPPQPQHVPELPPASSRTFI